MFENNLDVISQFLINVPGVKYVIYGISNHYNVCSSTQYITDYIDFDVGFGLILKHIVFIVL